MSVVRYVATLIVDGAFSDERTFEDYDRAFRWLEREVKGYERRGLEAEGYVMECYCPEDSTEPCECAQYAISHLPVVRSELETDFEE